MNSVMQAWADLPPVFADRLMALLTAPGRLAHGLAYVNGLLLAVDRACEPHWHRPLRWAALYGVAVHDPRASDDDNRRASVELWAEHFSALHETVRGVSAQWDRDVGVAITADPLARPDGLLAWQHAFLDLRLGQFGAAPLVYEAARLLERAEAEAAGLNEPRWRAMRLARLERVAASPRLFHRIYAERETMARANVAAERAALSVLPSCAAAP